MESVLSYCKWAVTTSVDSLSDSYCPSLGTKAWMWQTVLTLCRIMFMLTRENKLLLLKKKVPPKIVPLPFLTEPPAGGTRGVKRRKKDGDSKDKE